MSGWSPYSTIIDTIFNVYSFSWSETIVVKMVNFQCLSSPADGSVMWTHTVAHRWGWLVSWSISSVVVLWLHWTRPWPGDYIGHGPTDVSHERWRLPELMVVHIAVVARWLHWTRPDKCLPWIRKNLICDCWGSKNINKVPFPKQKY